MLGCPHAAIEQLQRGGATARRQEGERQLQPVDLHVARGQEPGSRRGHPKTIGDAGGVLLTDTCSAFAQALPPGTKVAALDSAKQVHYLPAILGVQAWFGSTTDCINAAVTGRWAGELR